MASGQNKRVQHLYPNLPKAMFPLRDKPFLGHYAETLFNEGIKEIIIIVNYLGEVIEEYVKKIRNEIPGEISVVRRLDEIGPVGVLPLIENKLQNQFLYLYCDILFKTDFKAAFEELKKSDFQAGTFITQDPFNMYSQMEILIDKNIKTVEEFSPDKFSREDGWMDVGQIYKKTVIEKIKKLPPEEEHLNRYLWPDLISQKKLTYFKVGPVFDYGTEESIKKTRKIYEERGLSALGGV